MPMKFKATPARLPSQMTLVETAEMPMDSSVTTAGQAMSGRPGELTLTGSQVLSGCLVAFCTVRLLLWAVIKLWLFEP